MSTQNPRRAVTLVELLVVIAVIGLLVQLLLPAVQAARESARRVQCTAQLRRLASAASAHVAAHGHFPAGGWNWRWLGDPRRGVGRKQPGGWIFNLLPYLDAESLRRRELVSRGIEDFAVTLQRTTPGGLNCPSRRGAGPFRRAPFRGADRAYRNAPAALTQTRSDYAVNGGDFYANLGRGPRSLRQVDTGAFRWPGYLRKATGMAHAGSRVRPREVRDGLAKTYLFGEKYLPSAHYKDGRDYGDDGSMYQGDDMDTTRWTCVTISDAFHRIDRRDNQPRPDSHPSGSSYGFGSNHHDGWHAAFCDGSVRRLDYGMDAQLHRRMGNRRDVRDR